MINVKPLLKKAATSKFQLKKTNFLFSIGIPFNKPHKVTIQSLSETEVKCYLPYIKRNFNHLRGIHAAALATVGEYAAGLAMAQHFNSSHYRLIMTKLDVEYFNQARQAVVASASFSSDDWARLEEALKVEESVVFTLSSQLHNAELIGKNDHLATVTTQWQLKPWAKIKVD